MRNTIGVKRGSVRGVPPQVFLPLSGFGNGGDSFEETYKVFRAFFWVAAVWLIIYVIGAIIWTTITQKSGSDYLYLSQMDKYWS